MFSGAASGQNASGEWHVTVLLTPPQGRNAPPALPLLQGLFPRRIRQGVSALHNRLVEESLRQRRRQQRQHAARAGGFAKQGDVVRIATESGNILPNPFKCGNLIQQRKVMHHPVFFSLQRGMGKEAKVTKTVIDRHNHHARALPAPYRYRAAGHPRQW